ncbi:Purple acid phosphatase [Balamuthia mandrillaris]
MRSSAACCCLVVLLAVVARAHPLAAPPVLVAAEEEKGETWRRIEVEEEAQLQDLTFMPRDTSDKPVFVHLAFAGAPTRMAVSWWTQVKTEASVVKYGLQPGKYTSAAKGTSRTYKESIGYTHDVVLTDLVPGSTYYYICGDGSSDVSKWSAEYNFTAAPVRGPPATAPTRVAMYGDMGTWYSSDTIKRVAELIHKGSLDFVYHVGDMSYANDRISYWYQSVWDEWFGMMTPVMSRVPYMVCPGNHEQQSGFPTLSYSTKFNLYNYRFRMPFQESNSTGQNMWFSFDYKNVHFISISTETDFPGCPFADTFGNQLAWLEADLQKANNNRAQVPWIIVVGHRPMYSSVDSIYVQWYVDGLRKAVEKLFHTYQVDLYVCGHVHSYERTWPLLDGKKTASSYDHPPSLSQIVTGAAGCIEGLNDGWASSPAAWSAHRYGKGEGYGVLEVFNSTTLQWSFFRSADNGLEDFFVLRK